MDTYFAPPERAHPAQLDREVWLVNNSSAVAALLQSVPGMIALLNRHRQVLAVNDALLRELGVEDPGGVLGLRPGEALHCVHAHEQPGGCGTDRHCSTCGAAVAIVVGLAEDTAVERVCALTTDKGGRKVDVCLLVRAVPFRLEEERFLLLFLQDVSRQWRRAALERTFLHDIANMLGGLSGAASLVAAGDTDPEVVGIVRGCASRLAREIALQRALLRDEDLREAVPERTTAGHVLEELQQLFVSHPAAAGKRILLDATAADVAVDVDLSLLLRVLGNMVTNALEASVAGDRVQVKAETERGRLCFSVWNRQAIDSRVAMRVFQRNFSTKPGEGRGFGTYAMKLIGERYLGAEVGFSSAPAKGTVFRVSLPLPQVA